MTNNVVEDRLIDAIDRRMGNRDTWGPLPIVFPPRATPARRRIVTIADLRRSSEA